MRKFTPINPTSVKKLVWRTVDEGNSDNVQNKKAEETQKKSLPVCYNRDVVIHEASSFEQDAFESMSCKTSAVMNLGKESLADPFQEKTLVMKNGFQVDKKKIHGKESSITVNEEVFSIEVKEEESTMKVKVEESATKVKVEESTKKLNVEESTMKVKVEESSKKVKVEEFIVKVNEEEFNMNVKESTMKEKVEESTMKVNKEEFTVNVKEKALSEEVEPFLVASTKQVKSEAVWTKEDAGCGDYYSDSYAHFSIHEEMLRDNVRTLSYRDAMLHNKHLFRGKVVLDVGCGTGILSMFAAKAGAARVIGVDMSSIADSAMEVVAENGLEDVVTIIRGKLEEVELPDGITKVDIIVSEWMGYCLLYENMLDSVIFARDKFLVAGGLIFPDRCSLYIYGMDDLNTKAKKYEVWNDVYGYKMSSFRRMSVMEPVVEYIDYRTVVTSPCLVKEVDIQTCTREDVRVDSAFQLEVGRTGHLTALVTHFDITFSHCHVPITFSTGPAAPATHWKQTYFHLEGHITAREGELVTGNFSMAPNSRNNRDFDIRISVEHRGELGELREENDYMLR